MPPGKDKLLLVVALTMGATLIEPYARASSGIGGLEGPVVAILPLLLIALLAIVLGTATSEGL